MDKTTSLLLVDDDETFRTVLSAELARRGWAVTAVATGAQALAAVAAEEPDLMLLDLRLPDADGLDVLRAVRGHPARTEVIVLTGHGTIDTAIEAIRLGAFDYVAKPCPLDELEMRLAKARERRSLLSRNTILEDALTPRDPAADLVGRSTAHRALLQLVERVAPTGSTVLILGETGTGKELVAKLIHARSPRRDRPFVIVDCAGLQEELLQSELFGHEKGAFTGAVRRKHGLFEVADGGTVFLDEIGEMSPATQAKLLRVLETSMFRRLGDVRETRVDVRVLAATNRDLPSAVRRGTFRDDLYYRLNAFRIRVEPLRRRPEDIADLVQRVVARHRERFGAAPHLSPDALAALERYDWPGNVRELIHVVEHALFFTDGPEVLVEHLPPAVRSPGHCDDSLDATPPLTLAALERAHVERVLRLTNGHRGRTAEILGISERNLYRKLLEWGLR